MYWARYVLVAQALHSTTNAEVGWGMLQDITFRAAADVLGFMKHSHKDWFDENVSQIKSFLNSIHAAHLRWIDGRGSASKLSSYLQLRRLAQSRLRSMKDSWWAARVEEIQEAADTNNVKRFYAGLKAVYGPSSPSITPLHSSEGQHIITDPNKILENYNEHFNGILHCPSSISDVAIDSLPQWPILEDLAQLLTKIEATRDINDRSLAFWSSRQAPGDDGIPSEIFKVGGANLLT